MRGNLRIDTASRETAVARYSPIHAFTGSFPSRLRRLSAPSPVVVRQYNINGTRSADVSQQIEVRRGTHQPAREIILPAIPNKVYWDAERVSSGYLLRGTRKLLIRRTLYLSRHGYLFVGVNHVFGLVLEGGPGATATRPNSKSKRGPKRAGKNFLEQFGAHPAKSFRISKRVETERFVQVGGNASACRRVCPLNAKSFVFMHLKSMRY